MRTMLHLRKPLLLATCIILTNIGFSQLTRQCVARYNGSGNGRDEARSLAKSSWSQTGKISVIK